MKPYYISLGPLVAWREAKHPIMWTELFGRDAPLELEIGFGNGAALVERAALHRERDFVGVELFWESVKRALRRAAQAETANVRLLLGNAGTMLDRVFAPCSLSRVYSLFPCPWPKERHLRHRLFSRDFLKKLNALLVPGGEVLVVTDFEAYVDWVRQEVGGTGFALEWEEVPARFGTKYERKWSELGQTRFFEIRLAKREEIVLPAKEEVELEIHKVERFDPERFEPPAARGEITVEFKEFLFDPRRHVGMSRVFVDEGGFHQHFWIEIAGVEKGWKIRPARGCPVIPTAGTQKALDLVRDGALQT